MIDHIYSNEATDLKLPRKSLRPQMDQVGGRVMLYKSSSGPSVALADDGLGRRTVIVWDSTPAQPIQIRGQGSFD